MATKPGLYANIHAKQKRIAAGSGEKMKKPGSKGAPTATITGPAYVNFVAYQLGGNYYLSKRTQVYGLVTQYKNNANAVWSPMQTGTNMLPSGGQTLTTYGAGLRTNF